MEPETVPAKALVGARERVEALHKSIVADGVALLGEDFHAFGLMPEPAPDPQVALGMALSATVENQKLLSKAVAQAKTRIEKAEAALKAEQEGGIYAKDRIEKLTKALIGSGAYGVCSTCRGAGTVADGDKTKPCGACSELTGLAKRTAKK